MPWALPLRSLRSLRPTSPVPSLSVFIGVHLWLLFLSVLLSGCAGEGSLPPASGPTPTATAPPTATATPTGYVEARDPCADHNPLRNVYYGDLHVHTTYSFDAHAFDVDTTPEQAYRFAQGDPVALPPLDATGHGTQTLRIAQPLDFAAVTDHSEYLGEIDVCTTPGSPTYDSATCETYRGDAYSAVRQFGVRLTGKPPRRFPDICGADDQICLQQAAAVWQREQAAAEAAYDRSAQCAFTSFVAYEYSASTGASTLHRNVIFRNDHVPLPVSVFEASTPQRLWMELQASCLEAGSGCDVLAIPHNSNESNGKMFLVEYPGATSIDEQRAQAAFRVAMEPLVEIYQHKGNSECLNGISGIIGAPDEQCEFERRRPAPFTDCGDGTGALGSTGQGCVSRLDYVRGALLAGLEEEERLGVNPYRLGIIASTDTHNGSPGATEESTFIGHRGTDDDTPAKQLGSGVLTDGGLIFGPGGLTAVWAEENSRPSIFDALRRREVFGTSGTRIAVRFFGGWSYPDSLCGDADLIDKGYAGGVPMGGVLTPEPPGATAPTFVISALRDSGNSIRPGTPLQRLQVVKGWIENGEPHQQVFEVAGDPENGATVDEATCIPQGPGADALCTVWSDPTFDPMQHAFYYARVIENPTCRWSTYVCNRLPAADRPAACGDPNTPRAIQERAWTSPIWYVPGT
jgi:hypothetical protein